MKAMILSAGVGSRLFPLTDKLPKPMLNLANKPALEYLVELCKKHGIRDIRMNLHYLPEEIDAYFQDGKNFGVNISYSLEKNLLGTAGAVKRSENFLDDTFVVLSGDGFTNIDLSEMLQFHKNSGAKVTIAVKKVEDPSKFGVVVANMEGKIQGFQEKPKREEAKSDLVNLGIYIIEPEIFQYIPKNESYDFGYQLFPKLLELNIPFYSFQTDSYWTDIGDIKEYWRLNLDMISSRLNGFDSGKFGKNNQGFIVGEGTEIQDSSLKHSNGPVLIGRNCKIGKDVTISGPVVIGDNVILEKGSIVMDSVILSNTRVGKNVNVTNSVITENYMVNVLHNYGMMVDDQTVIDSVAKESVPDIISKLFLGLFDRVIALAALTFLSPIFLFIAFIIKLDSKGPVFYRSKRILSPAVKKNGKNWNLYKRERGINYTVFRTMYTNSDKKINNLVNKYESGPFVKVENDPRITRIGKLLRKSSLDELPLLLNVLKGDMSLVGIWALPTYEAESLLLNGLKYYSGNNMVDFTEMAQVRFSGRAGLAGYWQSKGRSKLSAEERALHDSFQAAQFRYGKKHKRILGKYSNHTSVPGFFNIIIETFFSVIKRAGAM